MTEIVINRVKKAVPFYEVIHKDVSMKKTLLLFICIFWTILSFAQHELNQQYLVYLYDGSFLKGELLAEDEEAIQLRIINGETLTLPMTLIQKMSRNKKSQSFLPKGITIQESGPYHIINGGALFGKETGFSDNYTTGVSFGYTYGHQFNKYISVGGGISLDTYDDSFLPVYLDFRGYLMNKPTSIFYSVHAGYAVAFDQFKKDKEGTYFKGGPIVHPAIGLRFAGKQNYSFLMDIGYRFQYVKRESSWNENITDKITFKRLSLRMGFLF